MATYTNKSTNNKIQNNRTAKSKKELFSEYIKAHNLENLISEMANSVVHELAPNPVVYMIKYLTGLLSEDDRTSNGINIDPPYPQGVPIVQFPNFKTTSLLSKYLNRDMWQSLKYIKTKYNNNINTLTHLSNSDDPIGICLVDGDCIFSYEEILDDIISEVHLIKGIQKENDFYHINNFAQISKEELKFIERMKDNLNMIRFQFCRNIDGFSFNNSNKNNRKVKEDLIKCINTLINDRIVDDDMKMYTNEESYREIIEEVTKGEIKWMKNAGLDMNDKDMCNSDDHTKSNRCVFSNSDHTIVFLVNFCNHIEMFFTCTKKDAPIDIVKLYNNSINILKHFSLNFQFESHPKFGFLTSDISLIGAGMRVFAEISLSNISKYNDIIKGQNFTHFEINNDNNTVIITQDYHLYEENEIAFLSRLLSRLCGLLVTDSSKSKALSFDKIEFNNKDNDCFIKSYDKTYDKMRYILSSNGNNINTIMKYYNEDIENEVIINDKHEYYSFYPFISQYILLEQNFNCDLFNHINKPENPREITKISEEEYLSLIHSIRICLFRNIQSYSFAVYNETDTKTVEQLIIKAINQINSKGHFANYYSLTDESTKEQANEIIKNNNLRIYHNDKMKKFNMQSKFPHNCGVIQFEKDNIFAIVNDIDHIKLFYSLSKPNESEDICKELVNLIKVMNELSNYINWEYDNKFGFFTAIPKYIGTGMKIEVILELDKLNEKNLDEWVKDKGYSWKVIEKNKYLFENKTTIGISETEMLCNLLYYIKDIIDLNNNANANI